MRPRCGEKGHGHQHPAPRGLTQLSPCPGDRLRGLHRQPHGSTLNLDFRAALSTRWLSQSAGLGGGGSLLLRVSEYMSHI